MSGNSPFDVREFGAHGDGRKDDTAAIQRALDAAAEVHGTVFVPPGTYACSTLRLPSQTGLTGLPTWTFREHGGSILRLVDDRARCLVDLTNAHGATLSGLCLDGAGLGQEIAGVLLDKPDYGKSEDTFRIERCRVGNFSGNGLHLQRAWCFSIRHSMIGYNRGNGIWVRGWDGFLLDNWLSCNKGAGYSATNENSMMIFTGNRIEYNTSGGMLLNGPKKYNISGNCLDRSGGPGIAISPRNGCARNITITGNLFYGSGAPNWHPVAPEENCHLRLEGVEGLTVVGNSMVVKRDAGDWSPRYGIVCRKLAWSVIKDNVMRHGALEELIRDLGEHGAEVMMKDNPGIAGIPPVSEHWKTPPPT